MLASYEVSHHHALRAEALARERRRRLARLPLMEFVPAVSPDHVAPRHLAPLVRLFEQASDEGNVRAWSSVPPQHGKSVTLFHLLVRALLRDPTKRHGYGTYSVDFAREQQEKAKKIAAAALLPLQRQTMEQWVTPQGGGIVWTGVGGQLTGRPIDGVFIADDLLKGRAEAESPAHRKAALDFLRSTVMTRLHPGASVILNATRWVPTDPTGVMISENKWPGVNLPAVNERGEALWPDKRPLDFLELQRVDVGEYDWWSLYMGEPRPRGGAVFDGVHAYDKLPEGAYREAVGFDAAYTAKSHADYSVALTGRLVGDTIYLTGMLRAQAEAGAFLDQLTARGIRRVTWFRSGTEKGLEAFMRRAGVTVDAITATGDKFARATPAAAAWNAGRIAVPAVGSEHHGPWVSTLLDEVLAFTGLGDAHDDIIDALAALHHALAKPTPKRPPQTSFSTRTYA